MLDKIISINHFPVDIEYFGIHMLYNEPVYGARSPGGFMPHTAGRLAPRYGARGPLGQYF